MSERPQRVAAESERLAHLEAEIGDLHAYLRIGSLIHDALEPERILEILLAAATSGNALGFDRALLLLADPDAEALQGRRGAGPSADAPVRGRAGLEEIVESAMRGLSHGRSGPLTRVARQLRYPMVAGRNVVVDALLTRSTKVVTDPASECVDPLLRAHVGSSGFVVAPVTSGIKGLGVVVADNAPSRRPIGPRSVSLLAALAAQAGHALERGRAFAAAHRRRLRSEAVEDLAREMLLSTHLERVLQTAARLAAQVFGAQRAVIWLRDSETGALRPGAAHGLAANAAAAFAALETTAREAMAHRRLVHEAAGESAAQPHPLGPSWALPVSIGEDVVGALVVAGHAGRTTRPADEPDAEDERFLSTVASIAAVAVLQARLTRRALDAEKASRESRAELTRTERLVALGDLAAKAARSIHEPLAALGVLAEEAARALDPADPNQQRLLRIRDEVERLAGPLEEAAELAHSEEPRLKMESLETIVRAAAASLADRVRARRVNVIERWAGSLPLLLLDRAKIGRAVTNVLRSAVESTPQMGKVLLETRLEGEWVELTVANEGSTSPGDLAERLFAAFATREETGSGLGFAISAQIVREHGGELRVSAREPWASVFTMRFPVRENRDRRRSDRRRGRDRRRAA